MHKEKVGVIQQRERESKGERVQERVGGKGEREERAERGCRRNITPPHTFFLCPNGQLQKIAENAWRTFVYQLNI